jgi:hypothetical protein
MLTRPPWIAFTDQEKQTIRYVWDDTRAVKDFTGDAAPVLRASMEMSLRARMVLCMGLYEWNVWRFVGLHRRREPLQIAEVGWCATVDPRYMTFFELTREEWRGPIEGPLWCAATWLQPAMSQGHKFPRGLYDAISLHTRMALHVLPDIDRFQEWLSIILRRLVEIYPLTPEDPFQDLFDQHVPQRLGSFIGRNVLDPTHEYDPVAGVSFLAHTLRDARMEENPFLSSPNYLKDAGFTDEPYVLPV